MIVRKPYISAFIALATLATPLWAQQAIKPSQKLILLQEIRSICKTVSINHTVQLSAFNTKFTKNVYNNWVATFKKDNPEIFNTYSSICTRYLENKTATSSNLANTNIWQDNKTLKVTQKKLQQQLRISQTYYQAVDHSWQQSILLLQKFAADMRTIAEADKKITIQEKGVEHMLHFLFQVKPLLLAAKSKIARINPSTDKTDLYIAPASSGTKPLIVSLHTANAMLQKLQQNMKETVASIQNAETQDINWEDRYLLLQDYTAELCLEETCKRDSAFKRTAWQAIEDVFFPYITDKRVNASVGAEVGFLFGLELELSLFDVLFLSDGRGILAPINANVAGFNPTQDSGVLLAMLSGKRFKEETHKYQNKEVHNYGLFYNRSVGNGDDISFIGKETDADGDPAGICFGILAKIDNATHHNFHCSLPFFDVQQNSAEYLQPYFANIADFTLVD